MTLRVKAGSFTTPTSTGNFPVTGLGFQPKGLIFKLSQSRSADDTHVFNGTPQAIGFGFSSGASDNYFWYGMTESATDAWQYRSSVDCLLTTDGINQRMRGRINSLDANGFTINLSNATDATVVDYIAFGGDDITGAKAFAFDDKTSTGTHPITGIGFEPTVVVFGDAWTQGTVELNNGASNSSIRPQLSFVTEANSVSMVCSVSPLNGSSQTLMTSLRTDNTALVYGFISSNTPATLATLTSMDIDGFTLNYSVAFAGNTTRRCGLALAGAFEVLAGQITEPVSAGNVDVAMTTPLQGALIMSQGRSSTTTMARGGGTTSMEIDNSWGIWSADGGHFTTAWSAYSGTGPEMISGRTSNDAFEVLDQTATNAATVVSSLVLDETISNTARFTFSAVSGATISIAYVLFGGDLPVIPSSTSIGRSFISM